MALMHPVCYSLLCRETPLNTKSVIFHLHAYNLQTATDLSAFQNIKTTQLFSLVPVYLLRQEFFSEASVARESAHLQ